MDRGMKMMRTDLRIRKRAEKVGKGAGGRMAAASFLKREDTPAMTTGEEKVMSRKRPGQPEKRENRKALKVMKADCIKNRIGKEIRSFGDDDFSLIVTFGEGDEGYDRTEEVSHQPGRDPHGKRADAVQPGSDQ